MASDIEVLTMLQTNAEGLRSYICTMGLGPVPGLYKIFDNATGQYDEQTDTNEADNKKPASLDTKKAVEAVQSATDLMVASNASNANNLAATGAVEMTATNISAADVAAVADAPLVAQSVATVGNKMAKLTADFVSEDDTGSNAVPTSQRAVSASSELIFSSMPNMAMQLPPIAQPTPLEFGNPFSSHNPPL